MTGTDALFGFFRRRRAPQFVTADDDHRWPPCMCGWPKRLCAEGVDGTVDGCPIWRKTQLRESEGSWGEPYERAMLREEEPQGRHFDLGDGGAA